MAMTCPRSRAGPGGRPHLRESARRRPTTSEPGATSRESLYDKAWRDRVESERAAYGRDGPPLDRQRAPSRRADEARPRQRDIRARSRQPVATGARDLRARGPRQEGHHRARPHRVELRQIRGADVEADSRNSAGLADLPEWMPGRRSTGAGGRARGPDYHPDPRRRGRCRAVRARACVARARGALARPAGERRAALHAGYGHLERARPLQRDTGRQDLEWTPARLARPRRRPWIGTEELDNGRFQ